VIFQFFPKPFWQLSKVEVIKMFSKIFRVLTQHRGQPEEETAEDSEVDSAQEETGSEVESAPVGQRHIFSFFFRGGLFPPGWPKSHFYSAQADTFFSLMY